jgi:PAS domain S-box-containing protein
MRPFRLCRLQLRLLLLILLGALPALLAVFLGALEMRGLAMRGAEREARQLARRAAARHEHLAEGTHQLLVSLTQVSAVRHGDNAGANRLFADLLREFPQYKNFGLMTPDGWIVASGIPMERPLNSADRPFFQRAMRRKSFVVGDYQVGRITKQATVNFAYPVFDRDGDVQRVLFVALGLDWLGQLAADADLPEGTTIRVLDGNGTVLARFPSVAEEAAQKPPEAEFLGALRNDGEGTIEARGPDGVRRLYSFTSAGDIEYGRLFVTVGFPVRALAADADRVLSRALWVLALAVALALVAAWLGGEVLVLRPVRTLLTATERLRQGDLTARSGLAHGQGELGRLAGAFDHLAETLEQRETQRRTAAEVAERERDFSARLIESSVDGIVAFDDGFRVTEWNPGMEQTSGYCKDEVIGQSVLEVFPFLIETGERQQIAETLAGKPVTSRGRAFDVPDKGRKGFFDSTYSPLRDETGRVVGGLAIVHETTERRRLDEQYRQAQKMEAVGQLAGGVAHDFNNLLTAIMGYGQLALRRVPADGRRHQDLEEILKAAERAAALTRQLLAFSRQQVLDPKVIDLNEIVTNLDKMLRRVIGEDIDLLTAPGENLGHVEADPGQIEQVIMNLVVNARDAMPEGGKLTIETANARFDEDSVRTRVDMRPGRYVMLAVSDTGHGMTPEMMSRIFEPFFTTKERGKGTGLGLSTVHGIVKQSGGNIEVYSEPGQGTTFKIYLPRAEGAAEQPPSHEESETRSAGTETILLVEDEDAIRRVISLSLQLHGYTVVEAADGSEAIALCELNSPPIDLLITDVVMPLMSGPELAQRVTRARPNLRVLFISGYIDRALIHQGLRQPGTAFLQKPFTPDTLASKVREFLDGPREKAA